MTPITDHCHKLKDGITTHHSLELGVCSVALFLGPNKQAQIMWHSSPSPRGSIEHAQDMTRLLQYALELAAQNV